MSDFTPYPEYPYPQGAPQFPQDGAYPPFQGQYQPQQSPYPAPPKPPVNKGPVMIWVAIVAVLALVAVFFLWRSFAPQVPPTPTPTSAAPVPSESTTSASHSASPTKKKTSATPEPTRFPDIDYNTGLERVVPWRDTDHRTGFRLLLCLARFDIRDDAVDDCTDVFMRFDRLAWDFPVRPNRSR